MAAVKVPAPRFRQIAGTDYHLDSVQRSARSAIQAVNAKAAADKAATDAAVAAATTSTTAVKSTLDALPDSAGETHTVTFKADVEQTVAHALGRDFRGWRVTRDYGDNPSQLVEVTTWPGHRKKEITLKSATDCTVDILVY